MVATLLPARPPFPSHMPITITVRKNGSLGITVEDAAQIRLVDHDGTPLEMPVGKGISLCRCGQSQRMPFCDSSHKVAPWESAPIGCRMEPDAPPA
jgi:CDGSH-type Zn-finger protein